MNILYTGLFFSHFYTCEQFHPILNLPKHNCVKRDYSVLLQFAQSGIRPLTTRVKGAEKNPGANISFYTIYIYIKTRPLSPGKMDTHR